MSHRLHEICEALTALHTEIPTLPREPHNPYDAEAIAVWLNCSSLFGLIKSKKKIGYIKASRADGLAPKIDKGALIVLKAYVRSFYADKDKKHPRVSLRIEMEEI